MRINGLRRHALPVASLALVAGLLAGCGGGTDTATDAAASDAGSDQASEPDTVATPEEAAGADTAVGAGELDACALLPESLAGELLGGAVVQQETNPTGFPTKGALPVQCSWDRDDGSGSLGVLANAYAGGLDAAIASLQDSTGDAGEEVAGVGDTALFFPGPVDLLVVFAQGLQFNLSSMGADDARDVLVRAGTGVVGNL